MSQSHSLETSRSTSRQAYLSSLPRWRRWLSRLNWHPVVDLEISAIECEKQIAQLKHESAQIRKDSAQIRKESEQIARENVRLAELNAKIAAILSSSDTSSTPQPPTAGPSPT